MPALLVMALSVGAAPPAPAWRVTRGPVRQTLVLSGRLVAANAERLNVPILESWRTTIKWLAEEGAHVAAGDVVARLDTTSQATDLAEEERALAEKRQERLLRERDGARERLQLQLARDQAALAFEKAKIEAAAPAEMIGARQHQDRQLALAKATKKRDETVQALATHAAKLKADLEKLDLEAVGLETQFARNRDALEALTLRAGRPGVVLYAEHPWEGRKLRVGDTVQTTWRVVEIPDLDSLEVEAFAPESDAGLLRAGQNAVVRLDAYPARRFDATIRSVAPRGEDRPQWGTAKYFPVALAVAAKDAEIMRPGMSVMAEVLVLERDDVLRVPIAATRWSGARLTAFPAGRAPVEIAPVAKDEFHVAVAPGGPLADGDVLEAPRAER